LVPPAPPALLGAGGTVDVERLAVDDDTLLRVRPGVAIPMDPEAPPAAARQRLVLGRAIAAHHDAGYEHWFAVETAALLHGLWVYGMADRVHLFQLYPPAVRRDPSSWEHRHHVVRHWTALPARDRTVVGGLPVTSLERTAADCARLLRFDQALVVMDCALRHGADEAMIATILGESKGKRGVVQARRVLALADRGAESPGESLVRGALAEGGLPRAETQVRVTTARGEKWVDVGWPRARVGVEFDGEVKYGELAMGDPQAVRRAERVRHEVIEDEGWRLERAGWSDVVDLDARARFVARVRRALAGRWQFFAAAE
jgi:hypothetical protein